MKGIECAYPVRRISPENSHCFFGYYDIPAYDKSGKKHLYGETAFIDRLPVPGDKLRLGVIELDTCMASVFAETAAWNFQQGALLQWHGEKENTVFYNDFTDDGFVTVEHHLPTGKKRFSPAAASISADGKHGLAINFSRIYDFRPGYGYGQMPDSFAAQKTPKEDGVFLTDIAGGTKKQIINYEQIMEACPIPGKEKGKFLINHITFNPKGDRFLFLLRNFCSEECPSWDTSLITSDLEGNMTVLLKDSFVSHYHWKNDRQILAYCTAAEKTGLILIDDFTGETVLKPAPYFKSWEDDIHCVYSPDRRYIIGDNYPGETKYRTVYLMDTQSGDCRPILKAETNKNLLGDIRCDLHVRWSPDGTRFSFDSTHRGKRDICEVDLSDLLNGRKGGFHAVI